MKTTTFLAAFIAPAVPANIQIPLDQCRDCPEDDAQSCCGRCYMCCDC